MTKLTAKKVAETISDGISDSYYVNAADKKLKKGPSEYVTQFVEAGNHESVAFYGEFYNFVRPEISVYAADISAEVMAALKKDYDNGVLSENLRDTIEGADEDFEALESGLNPEDIVNSAELWDIEDFVEWFFVNFPQFYFVETIGGAVSHMALFEGEIVSVTTDEFSEILEG